MYLFSLLSAILGMVVAVGAVFAIAAAIVEHNSSWSNKRRAQLLAVLGIVLFVVGTVASVWGLGTATTIQREQCEAAGYEWITGTCYGANVNVQ